MSRKRTYRASPRPHSEPARNTARGIVGSPESIDMDDDIGSQSHKRQANRYFNGRSESGGNEQFKPSDISGSGLHGNDLGEVIDQSGRKAPWGGKSGSWSANAGKLGDLDPQETDQPSWVGTWSPLQEGPNGAGPVRDENYGVQRPRTQSRQEESFKRYNPEFQDVANDGDWTSWKHDTNV